MERDLRELNALIGELLGMAKLDSGQAMQRQPFELAPALRGCAAAQPHSARMALRISDDSLGLLDGDSRLLMRAVANLLANAAKYGAGQVRLSAAREDGAIVIAVEDDGPGIPEAERERVFEPFYRLDRSRDRASGGFGLGLAIARKAVALHGGTVRAGDSELGGARFVICVPA
jgi:signal transduction histidine kinase